MLGGGRFSRHKSLLLLVDLAPVAEVHSLGLSNKVSEEGQWIGLCPEVLDMVQESPVV